MTLRIFDTPHSKIFCANTPLVNAINELRCPASGSPLLCVCIKSAQTITQVILAYDLVLSTTTLQIAEKNTLRLQFNCWRETYQVKENIKKTSTSCKDILLKDKVKTNKVIYIKAFQKRQALPTRDIFSREYPLWLLNSSIIHEQYTDEISLGEPVWKSCNKFSQIMPALDLPFGDEILNHGSCRESWQSCTHCYGDISSSID